MSFTFNLQTKFMPRHILLIQLLHLLTVSLDYILDIVYPKSTVIISVIVFIDFIAFVDCFYVVGSYFFWILGSQGKG